MQIVTRALSDDGQVHCGTLFAADHAHSFRQCLTCGGFAVHFVDDIIGSKIHIRCRSSFDDTADLRQVRLGIHADIRTDTVVDSLGLFGQCIQFLCCIILGIRIVQGIHQATEHTVL